MPSPNFNGPGFEPDNVDLSDALCYCVNCGTVYVYHQNRDCPACTNAEAIADLQDRLDALHRVIDEDLGEIDAKLSRIESTTNVLADVAEEARGGV